MVKWKFKRGDKLWWRSPHLNSTVYTVLTKFEGTRAERHTYRLEWYENNKLCRTGVHKRAVEEYAILLTGIELVLYG